jgi:hypothetical protein
MRCIVRIERHELGPRLHLCGRRVHEYHAGVVTLLSSSVVTFGTAERFSAWTALAAVAGLWLVGKDWPDLFPATRDRASWRLGVHRLPPREAAARSGKCGREDSNLQGPKPNGT